MYTIEQWVWNKAEDQFFDLNFRKKERESESVSSYLHLYDILSLLVDLPPLKHVCRK